MSMEEKLKELEILLEEAGYEYLITDIYNIDLEDNTDVILEDNNLLTETI